MIATTRPMIATSAASTSSATKMRREPDRDPERHRRLARHAQHRFGLGHDSTGDRDRAFARALGTERALLDEVQRLFGPQRMPILDQRHCEEVVLGRRRVGRPFERVGVPRIRTGVLRIACATRTD